MKKLIIAALIAATPLFAQAIDVNIGGVRVQTPGVTVTFGSRDSRGYYWDGDVYRDSDYWKQHNGPRGQQYYTGRGNQGAAHQGGRHCPPGQAKKGNC
ncbi:MAG: DUF2502 domain-containing protein [Rhodocyclaceae bacterium]|nr:DUF2502 domain-containing protein [Rhodocyclaceae bacterium]MDP2107413.1 DUF2502 domain-containing protein [Rhodocyclaceae bacterium]MDP2196375.1 DUF2502 domain-containing protein [Rhodocyclaceae bacterium]MDP3036907.1 DUF2502 domain-containing protein [Rhodocyclaceae bacterium]